MGRHARGAGLLTLLAAFGGGCATTAASDATPRSLWDDERHGSSLAVSESHVPRVRCYDGSTSISSCNPQQPHASCCVNQGGVYRDAWGNAAGE